MARFQSLVPNALRPFARKLREAFQPTVTVNQPLVPSDCRAELHVSPAQMQFPQQDFTPIRVQVRNRGQALWSSAGPCPIELSTRWLTTRKDPLDHPIARYPLGRVIRPGEEYEIRLDVLAPPFLGHFLVEFDLIQSGTTPFRDQGSKPFFLDAQVTGRDSDDINYYKVYATADLSRDYWTVVGPDTKEEFEKLGHVKLDTLKRLGLTPDSRVLDVGCGTGQLAIPMESFLSDKGCYVGTDIGEEAIRFCQERFRRPNFRFYHNPMTTIPLTGEQFDFITYFSVFTHTFPDETVLLLAESRRLLAPGGLILGDVFTSPMVDRCSGNRGAIELNRDHFLRLVELAGLQVEVIDSWPWKTYGRREVLKYTRRD